MTRPGPLLFNPTQASEQELERTFVGRWPVLEHLQHDILADAGPGTTRHWQIIGPRGSGKSHLTELLSRRLARAGWSVARLPEEHYKVAGLADLLEQIVIRLGGGKSPFVKEEEPSRIEELAAAWLREHHKKAGKPAVVILENLGVLLERKLTSQRDQSRLRELLMRDAPFTLVSTSTSYVDATVRHDAPFYDFFQSITLEDLSREDVASLIEARARWDEDRDLLAKLDDVKQRIEAIYHLSGGNPRLSLALYGVLRGGVTQELHDQMLELLDQITPYYQARLNDITPQMVRIFAEMALAEGPLTPAEIGRRCRMATNQVTSNVNRLVLERFVRAGARPDMRRRYYEVNDRLFRLWMQMREGEGPRQRLRFLIEFFQRWYEGQPQEIDEAADRVASEFWIQLHEGKHERCTELLTTFDYLCEALPEMANAETISLAIGSALPKKAPELAQYPSKLHELLANARDKQQRDNIHYAIAVTYRELGHTDASLADLRSIVSEEGQHHWQIWAEYIEAVKVREGAQAAYLEAAAIDKSGDCFELHRIMCQLAIRIKRPVDALSMHKQYIGKVACDHCRANATIDCIVMLALYRFFAQAREVQGNAASMTVVCDAATSGDFSRRLKATEILFLLPEDDSFNYYQALECVDDFGGMSKAPLWLIEFLSCHSSHKVELAASAAVLLSAIDLRRKDVGVDFLPHAILVYVALINDNNPVATTFVDVLERRAALGLAAQFTKFVPRLAKRDKSFGLSIIEAYRRLRDRKLLPGDFLPYSAASAVLEAPDRSLALMALHPEVREAVAMILDPVDANPSEARGQFNVPPTRGAAVARSISPTVAATPGPSVSSQPPALKRRAPSAKRSPGDSPARSPRR